MQTNIFQKNDSAYVIIDTHSILSPLEALHIVGVAYSYENALKFAGPNRVIHGPVPILTTYDFSVPITIPMPYKSREFDISSPNLIDKNPFESIKPKEFGLPTEFKSTNPINFNPFWEKPSHDFSMFTPPSSRIGSTSSSPVVDQYL